MERYITLTRLIVNGHDNFMNDAYNLLKANQNTSDKCEKVMYDKLFEVMVEIVLRKGKNYKRMEALICDLYFLL